MLVNAHVVISVLLAVGLAGAAALDFARYEPILSSMAKAGVPASWLTTLGTLKAAGALGVLIGLAVPPIGMTAAAGVVLFFVGAIVTHLRVHDRGFGLAAGFLLLAAATLGLGLVT
jgi:hypothetical protein